ncbi:MAG: hypothetical protein ACPHK0_01740 [Dehalococcoidia bacterium]|jgi:hypothetical protein
MIYFLGRRRPVFVGFILGTVLGAAVALGYGLTAGWLCSGIRECPASWIPFAFISSIIFFIVLGMTTLVTVILTKLYRIFDTVLITYSDSE